MAISHRSNRLKLKGSPSVEKLQNGRYKLTITCSTMNSREDWYSANKDRIFPDFGDLQSAAINNIDGLSPRSGEAYTDMKLTEVQSGSRSPRDGEDYVIIFVYETLGSSFVLVQDDAVTLAENGLRRVTRKSIAEAGTDFQKTIGSSSISSQLDNETAVVCKLASYEVNDTDSYREVTEVYIEPGIVSTVEDFEGSQKTVIQETFSQDPVTPTGFSKAREEVSNVDGIPTNRHTFLKDNTVLSESEDKIGSQKAIVKEVFNGEPSAPSGEYALADSQISNVDGIPTKRFRFLKSGVELSRSEDRVGSQEAITTELFNPDNEPDAPTGYELASTQESNVDGVPTKSFTFLKTNIKLSESTDKVGSQLAIVQEWFKPDAEPSVSDYLIANVEESNLGDFPTERYTFLKNNAVLSESEDKVGSQKAIVREIFGNNITDPTDSDYKIARTETSSVDGIPTKRFTLLKEDTVLSRSEDKVGSQLAIIIESFDPASDPTESGYSVARTEVSDVDGIPTKRFTFLKDNAELSRNEDKVGSQLAITTEVFNPDSDPTEGGYVLARTNVSDVDGIPTKRFTFLKENVTLATSIDKRNGNSTSGFALIRESIEVFKPTGTPSPETTGAVLVGEDVSDVEGIPTKRFTFAKGDGEIIVDKRPAQPQLAGCTQVTVTTLGSSEPADPTGVIIGRTESEDNGYKTFVVTAIQGTIEEVKQEYVDVVDVEVPGEVSLEEQNIAINGVADNVLGITNMTGTIAVANVTPRRVKKIACDVKVEITQTPPNTASLAFDLGEISCSVTSLSMNYAAKIGPTKRYKVGIFITPKTDWQRSFSPSARIQTYPGCFLSNGTSKSGTVSYQSQKFYQLEPDEDEDGYADGLESTITGTSVSETQVIGEGSTDKNGYNETGIIKRSSRPIFTDLEGNTYFEVITWSKSSSSSSS